MTSNVINKQSEILFVFINNDYMACNGLSYHLGAGYIRAYLQEREVASKQFVCKEPITLTELVEKILAENTPVVGFTCYDFNYYHNKLVAQRLKKHDPYLTIIFGGTTATFSDELVLNDCEAVDICVRGEGEQTVYELLQVLGNGEELSSVEGISYRAGGRVVRNLDSPLIRGEKRGEELDVLPSPYLSGMIPLTEGADVGILTSRGCVYKCTYCNFTIMSRHTIRYHSVDRVMSELISICSVAENQNRVIQFFDDAFSLNIDRAKEICRKIIENRLQENFFFLCATRADCLDRELLKLMSEAKLGMAMGIESAVPNVLAEVKKVRFNRPKEDDEFLPEKKFLQAVREKVKFAKQVGVAPVAVSIILGLPGESFADGCASVEFVKEIEVTEYAHNVLKVYPGTELFRTHRNYGLKVEPSVQVLPYETFHTYDVSKVPLLNNAVHLRIWRERKAQLIESLLGGGGDYDRGVQYIFLKGISPVDLHTFSWLVEAMPLTARVCVMNDNSETNIVEEFFKQMTWAKVPITSFNYLWEDDIQANEIFTAFRYGNSAYERTIRDSNRLCLVLFSKYESFLNIDFELFEDTSPHSSDGLGTLALMIETDEDFQVFRELIDKTVNTENFTIPNSVLNYDCFVVDECRWSDKICPASKICKLIVENGSILKPCLTGKSFAMIGESDTIGVFSDQIRLLHQREMVARGCEKCPIKDKCSKCLFPYPMNSQEYCEFRREYADLDWIADVMKVLRGLRALRKKHSIPLGEDAIRITMTKPVQDESRKGTALKDGFRIASIGNQSYLCQANEGRFYRVGEASAWILEELLRCRTPQNIIGRMTAKYECSHEEAVAAMDEAMKQFAELGLLEG